MITKRQKDVLEFVKSYSRKNEYAPSLDEIRRGLGLSSVSTIHFHISNLTAAGYLDQQKNKARSINLPQNEPSVKNPLVDTAAAGEPIKAIEKHEFIHVPKTKLSKNGKVYDLKVRGGSMVGGNINDGDLILVKQQKATEKNQQVITLDDTVTRSLPRKIGPVQAGKRKNMLPLNKVILGDALRELKKLPDESCDVIVIDPPYNIGKDFGNNGDKRELGEYIAWCKEWINESIRILKPTGTIFIYGFSEILAYLSVEIPIKKRWLIWHYTNKNVASLNFWQRSHESIICAWKNKPVFNRDEIREPYTEGFLNGAAGKVRKGTVGRFSKGITETVYKAHAGGALPRDVIKVAALAGGAGMIERWFLCRTCDDVFEPQKLKEHNKHEVVKHPTQKPLELSRKLILSAMPANGGVVLVPFVGTGSECVAAKELGQSYIGFEINPDYLKLAEKFIASTSFNATLF